MGSMIARGGIGQTDAVDQISEAAIASGLDVDEVQATLASGLLASRSRHTIWRNVRIRMRGKVRRRDPVENLGRVSMVIAVLRSMTVARGLSPPQAPPRRGSKARLQAPMQSDPIATI